MFDTRFDYFMEKLNDSTSHNENKVERCVLSLPEAFKNFDEHGTEFTYAFDIFKNLMENPAAADIIKLHYPTLAKMFAAYQQYNGTTEKYAFNEQFLATVMSAGVDKELGEVVKKFSDGSKLLYLGCGSRTSVFKISKKHILKLGQKKVYWELPNSDLWAYPLVRERRINENQEMTCFWEVQRQLDTLDCEDESNLEYAKEIMNLAGKEGWCWYDFGISNIGLLRPDDANEHIAAPQELGFLDMPKAEEQDCPARIIDLDFGVKN